MVIDYLNQLLSWVSSHPNLAGVLVALVAFLESLAFVGILVLGSTLMIGAGALVGTGALEFWSTLAWAVAGAIVGDGVSYWIGHYYRDRLRQLKPLQRRPQLLASGEAFMHSHGGKSILLARFVGPVRPVIPVVAGMLGMAPLRFYLYNILSAVGWAPAHLLPGMAFGASLALAGHVAARLALLLGVLLVSAWLFIWIFRVVYRRFHPHAAQWANDLLKWAKSHRLFAWLIADLLDPARPASRALVVWFALLFAAAWLFLGVVEDVLNVDPLVYSGQAFYHLLQQLRTPLGDRIMVVLTELGDVQVVLPVTVAVLLWLLWRRDWRDAFYWLGAVVFGALAVAGIKFTLHLPRPIDLYSSVDAYSFPSGHATMAAVVYGFLAVLTAQSQGERTRWIPYAVSTLLICLIAFSRLYLGAHWLADVVAGLALGMAWVSISAIAREHHRRGAATVKGLLPVATLVFAVSAVWHINTQSAADIDRYAVRHTSEQLPLAQWWNSAWAILPVYRIDLEGEQKQPLNIQWAGNIETIRRQLLSKGWREPPALNWRTALLWLSPEPALKQLPLLPRLHDGFHESLRLVHAVGSASDKHLVLRLWSAAVTLQPGNTPLWIGSVDWQRVQHLPLISVPRFAARYDEALAVIPLLLGEPHWKLVRRTTDERGPNNAWAGNVLLVDSEP